MPIPPNENIKEIRDSAATREDAALLPLNSDFITGPKPQGTVIMENITSYSGADIKVVVNVYDNGKTRQLQLVQLEKEIDRLQDLVTSMEKDVNTSQPQIDLIENAIIVRQDEMRALQKLNPGYSNKVLAELQTLSISTHREKFPVRALGAVYPKSFTRGPRTIAGSMIFTVFDRHVLEQFLESHPSDFDAHVGATSCLIDQIPPFDIVVTFANELGQVSKMVVYGVEFVNEGQTMSIEDILLENVTQFVARDVDPMTSVSKRKKDEDGQLTSALVPVRATSLLNSPEYKKYKEQLSSYDKFKRRSDPFV